MAARVTTNGGRPTFEFEKLTVSSTAKALTATKYVKRSTSDIPNQVAHFAVISVETDQIRYRLDGTDPDSSTGHLLSAGDVLVLDNPDDIRNFRAIRVTTDATIQVSYS